MEHSGHLMERSSHPLDHPSDNSVYRPADALFAEVRGVQLVASLGLAPELLNDGDQVKVQVRVRCRRRAAFQVPGGPLHADGGDDGA